MAESNQDPGLQSPSKEVVVADSVKLPPTWFKHAFWRGHRFLNRVSGGRFLWSPHDKRGWGAMRLTTVGRETHRNRMVIIGYLEDGTDLVALAMNGWDQGDPAWWRNLQAHPDAMVQLSHQRARPVHEATPADHQGP